MIEFSGRKSYWKSWSVKFYANGNLRGYKKLLVDEGKTVSVEKMPTQTEFEKAEHGSSVQDEAVKKLGKLNVLAYKNILLSIDTKNAGKVAISLILVTLKTVLKETVGLHGFASIQSLSQIHHLDTILLPPIESYHTSTPVQQVLAREQPKLLSCTIATCKVI